MENKLLSESVFLKACRCENTDYTPIWLMRQAGRYMKEYQDIRSKVPFLELCRSPELATEVMVTAVERLGVDASIIFSDILLILQPMGLELEYIEGVGPVLHNPVRTPEQAQMLKDVEPGDLVKYGLIPEFIGRLPVLASLEDLDEEALVTILTKPKNALLKQYQKLFEMENTNLEFRENALKAIAQKAISLKTGARGLRSIIENILMDTMFELPSEPDINEVVINEEVVTKGSKPILVHEKKTKEIKNSV